MSAAAIRVNGQAREGHGRQEEGRDDKAFDGARVQDDDAEQQDREDLHPRVEAVNRGVPGDKLAEVQGLHRPPPVPDPMRAVISRKASSTERTSGRTPQPCARSRPMSSVTWGVLRPTARRTSASRKTSRGAVAVDFPPAHHDDPVGIDDLVHAVGHVDDRDPLLPELPEDVENPLAPRRVEIGSGLVENHIGRPHGQHAGDGHKALFASRQRVGSALGKPEHPHRLQGHTHPPADLRRRKAEVARPEGDVLLDTHPHDLVVGVLEDHADAPADLAVCLGVFRVEAIDEDLPLLRDEQGVEVFHEGGFPAPVGSDDGHVLPFGDFQADPLQDGRVFRVVSVNEMLCLDHNRILSFTFMTITEAAAISSASPGRKGSTPAAAAFSTDNFPSRTSWRTPSV